MRSPWGRRSTQYPAIFCALGLTLGVVPSPVAFAGEPEAYQHLAERMDGYFSDERPRLIQSFIGTSDRPAFIYDNALAAIVLVGRGTPDDLRRAKLICDALLWYQGHDAFADGRLRQAYQADQDLVTAGRPKKYYGTTNTGELAWAGIAWLTYFERVRDPQITDPFQDPHARYLQAAIDVAEFLATRVRGSDGFYLGFREKPFEITTGVPVAAYGTVTTSPQDVAIPLTAFTAQGLNLERLRAISLVFGDAQFRTGTITFQQIKLVNISTGASLTIDDFADTQPVANALGFQIGGIVNIASHPTGRTIIWNSADGSVDWWYSLLFDHVHQPLARLDGADYTHLILRLSGSTGGERFTVELQGYPLDQELLAGKSTEHNLDAYVLFMRLFDITGDPQWDGYAREAKRFVTDTAWDPEAGKFLAGGSDDAVDQVHLVEDVQSWALLALGSVGRYGNALAWAEQYLGVSTDGFTGFDFGINIDPTDVWYSPVSDGVWFEGTAHMSSAYQVSRVAGGVDLSAYYLNELDRAQQSAMRTDGKGLPAASHDGVTTGLNFSYNAWPHIGATAWYIAAKRHLNLFWGTSTDEPVPHDNRPPLLDAVGDRTIPEGQPLAFTVHAEDPDGDAVTYGASPLPAGASLDEGSGAFAWTPGFSQAGSYPLILTAGDGKLSDSEAITITVTNVNQPPMAWTVSPTSGSSRARAQVTFTTTYTDPDGWQDLRRVFFLVNTSLSGAKAAYASYNQDTNTLMLRNDAGTAWLPGCTPGQGRILKNAQVKLDCAKTKIRGTGTTLTVKWKLTFKPAFVGTKATYLKARDDAGTEAGWVQAGTWTVTP